MSIRKMQGSNPHQPPADLPDNVPVSVTTTWKKVVGQGDEVDDVVETIDDHRHSKWSIHAMGDSGWEQIGLEEGRPYSHDLRLVYGAGRYKCVPLNPNGDPIERLAVIELVAPSPNATGSGKVAATAPAAPADDMPPFMRMLLAQQAEERAEARRAASAAAAQRQEWEREQAKREWQRAERSERMEQERALKEAEERRLSAERTDKLLAAGMTLAGTLMQSITTAVAAKPFRFFSGSC